MLGTAVEDLVVELEAGLERLAVAVCEDARPVDGHAEDVPAHLGKERDVLFVVMIEVGRFPAGIQCVGVEDLVDLARNAVDAVAATQVVVNAGALAVYVPRALVLVCRRRTAPQEALGKSHRNHLLSVEKSLQSYYPQRVAGETAHR